MTAREYYDEGYDSSPDTENPYDIDSFAGQAWEAGHEAAEAAEGAANDH